jgi:hypothetical protein
VIKCTLYLFLCHSQAFSPEKRGGEVKRKFIAIERLDKKGKKYIHNARERERENTHYNKRGKEEWKSTPLKSALHAKS